MTMNEDNKKSIPLYTKAGWVVAWLVMLAIAAMIMRNCAGAIFYGSKTEKEAVEYSYAQGKKAGQTGLKEMPPDLDLDNPVLRKSYNKGYREGLDGSMGTGKQ